MVPQVCDGLFKSPGRRIANYMTFTLCLFYSPKIKMAIIGCQIHYHSPRKHYLPEKNMFELFSDYRFTILISLNYNFRKVPDTYWHLCELCDITRLGPPVLAELFFITVTRFEFFRINWVMFSWQMVGKNFRTRGKQSAFAKRDACKRGLRKLGP